MYSTSSPSGVGEAILEFKFNLADRAGAAFPDLNLLVKIGNAAVTTPGGYMCSRGQCNMPRLATFLLQRYQADTPRVTSKIDTGLNFHTFPGLCMHPENTRFQLPQFGSLGSLAKGTALKSVRLFIKSGGNLGLRKLPYVEMLTVLASTYILVWPRCCTSYSYQRPLSRTKTKTIRNSFGQFSMNTVMRFGRRRSLNLF